MTTRDNLIELLAKTYPGMLLRTTEEFNGSQGGIWTSGEDRIKARDRFDLFNYYSESYNKYEIGVHREIYDLLRENGWYAEWYDAGTVMLWPE